MILRRHIAGQILLTSVGSVLMLGAPVILIALLNHIPGTALRTSLAWGALTGLAPAALGLVLPVAVGLGCTWAFAQLRANSAIDVIYSLRISVAALAVPVLWVAVPAMLLTFTISCVLAPRASSSFHDIRFIIRNNLSAALFQPQTFYTLDNGRYTLFFDRKFDDDQVGGVLFQEMKEDGSTQIIIAREARFETRGDERHIVFAEGTMQSVDRGGTNARTAVFDELSRPFGEGGTAQAPKREWRGLFEMETPEFLNLLQRGVLRGRMGAAWLSEAVKRFGIPFLALAHPLAGMALVLAWRAQGGRRNLMPLLFCAPIVLLHLAILFGAEAIGYFSTWMAGLMIGLILLELIVPVVVLLRLQRRAL
jgi:lipopolysaccharide export system permease protein